MRGSPAWKSKRPTGTRIPGGWQLTGAGLPANATIRARGLTGDGHSSSIIEQTLNVPEIAVQEDTNADLTDGISTVNYGPVVSGNSSTQTLTIRNLGTVPLQNLAVSVAPGGNAGDFSVTQQPATTLAPGATITFNVTFTPTAAGTRTATVQVASNDPDENPFDITVTGRQATASEAWRITHFGSPDNTGPGADLSDPDNDGIVNLVEFATNSHPQAFTPPIGQLVKNGSTLEFTYTRPVAALADVRYDLEASSTVSGAWGGASQTETILSDNGILQQVKATYPAGITGKRFVRLRLTRR